MKKLIALNILLLVLVLLANTGCHISVGDEEHVVEDIVKTYSVNSGGSLTILSELGAINVQTAERNQVEIVVTKASRYKLLTQSAEEALADFEVTFANDDRGVRIEGEFKQGRKHWQRKLNRLDIRFQVTAPKDYNVDLDTQGGSIKVGDLNGTVRAHTSGGGLRFGNIIGTVWGHTSGGSIKLVSCGGPVDLKTSGGSIEVGDVAGDVRRQTSGGSLRFGKVQGSIWGKTSGGSIRVANCNGEVDVHTSGGSIKLERVGGSVNARTSGGSIRATLTGQPQNECNLRTSGGSVAITLMPDTVVDVDAETMAGSVSTDFRVASVIQGKVPRNRLKGSINGGGPLLKLRTSAGSIRLQKASD